MNINSNCICGPLNYKKNIICLLPCKHLFHKDCYSKNKMLRCYICNKKINKVVTKDICMNHLDNEFYKKINNNILSKTLDPNKIYFIILFNRLIYIIILFIKIYFVNDLDGLHKFIVKFLKLCNIKIKEENKNKDIDIKKIFISNHTSHIDFLILCSVGKDNFLHNNTLINVLNSFGLGKINNILKDKSICTKDQNTVKRIKKFLDKNDFLVIFPEGQRSNTKSLCKFASGAFSNNIPIQPVVIKFNKNVYFKSFSKTILNMISSNDLKVTLKYLDIEYPPFTEKKIENIREKMALEGDLFLSDVYYK
jgi:1-acyl-sn-glycerol-3-phosphate acyltransferase